MHRICFDFMRNLVIVVVSCMLTDYRCITLHSFHTTIHPSFWKMINAERTLLTPPFLP